MATEKQLIERWFTPRGQKIRDQIIDKIKKNNWERLLINFPFIEEVKNKKDLRFIHLGSSNLFKANLNYAHLSRANLSKTNLSYADLSYAVLKSANLRGANLSGANLRGADLNGADLNGADLREADLSNADLNGADLSGANLRRTKLSACRLIESDISGADLTNAYIYGISIWDIKIDKKTIMKNLIIYDDPLITVDDIEIAQFIYLISNNEKIKNLIDKMRTKVVLILGSFYDDKKSKITPKKVLNKIKEELSKKGMIPIVFDYNPSKELDLIANVKTLALLSSFIIVDLSLPAGQLTEIGNLVREFPIPFIPIASNETKHITNMVGKKAFGNYHWFKTNVIYYQLEDFNKQLPIMLKSEIIPWAKNKNKELEKERE